MATANSQERKWNILWWRVSIPLNIKSLTRRDPTASLGCSAPVWYGDLELKKKGKMQFLSTQKNIFFLLQLNVMALVYTCPQENNIFSCSNRKLVQTRSNQAWKKTLWRKSSVLTRMVTVILALTNSNWYCYRCYPMPILFEWRVTFNLIIFR